MGRVTSGPAAEVRSKTAVPAARHVTRARWLSFSEGACRARTARLAMQTPRWVL